MNIIKNTPEISIIVPVYKVEQYLQRCLDSILAQTFTDFEAILVDDGSPDSCGEICDKYAQNDSRIKVLHKENGGLSSARNAALDIATGKYVMFVDSDDWVEPDFCKSAYELVSNKGVDIVSFGFNNVIIDDKSQIKKTLPRATQAPRFIHLSEAIEQLITRKDVIFNLAWNKIYIRELFDDVRFPVGRTYEDNATTYLLFIKAKKIYVSDVILYNYVKRNDSISAIWNKPRSIVDRFEIWSQRLKDIREYSPENELRQIKQIANEAVEGIMYISAKSKYGLVLNNFRFFLSKYKSVILLSPCSYKIKLYYYCKPLLVLYKHVRSAKRLLQSFEIIFK